MDREVILNKLESLRRCVRRVESKTPDSAAGLSDDHDVQDIIVLNLERAVQTCVDIGMHMISDLEIPVPENMAQTFVSLRKAGYLSGETAERMVKAVGFRNTAVHAYQEIDWEIVYNIVTRHMDDFREFAREIIRAVA